MPNTTPELHVAEQPEQLSFEDRWNEIERARHDVVRLKGRWDEYKRLTSEAKKDYESALRLLLAGAVD